MDNDAHTPAAGHAAAVPPQQRTRLLDADRFELARLLRGAWTAIRDEMLALRDDDFAPWPNDGSYVGGWQVFPLSLQDHVDAGALGIDLQQNRGRCPATAAVFAGFGRHRAFGFSRLLPGGRVLPHRDGQRDGVLRLHLPLVVPPGCVFRIGTEQITWQPGEPLVFDGRNEHEVANIGHGTRTVLLADFELSPDEAAHVAEVRRTNGGPSALAAAPRGAP